MRDDVLENMSAADLARFQAMDPSILMFILTCAVFLDVAGSKQNESVLPFFFKTDHY